jgi:hypothetical protein
MNDTVELLRECDSGTKMAVSSIDDVLEKVRDVNLKKLLSDSKSRHGETGNKIHSMLADMGGDGKDPNPIAKSMATVKTDVMLTAGDDSTAADIITDGCSMGVKSLTRCLNRYKAASEPAKNVCREIIDMEESLGRDLRRYL